MNHDWQNFLTQQGACVHEGIAQHFGDFQAELLATRDGTVLCDLNQRGTLKVSGEEAQKFLQNLLSNDISAVNRKTAQLSSLNSPKGRMLATFMIWQKDSDYFLQLPRSLTTAMHKRLSMYVLRSKVKVGDASDEIVCLGLSGERAASLIKQRFGNALEHDWSVQQHEHGSVIRLAAQRYLVSASAATAADLWNEFARDAKVAGSGCWDWLDIRAGIPAITPATQEQYVLQMANLDLLGGVSFKKGCYPGQEIVARTHYLGKQKRRMFLAHLESDSAPLAGDELFSADMADQACGTVINASPAPGGGFDLLAVLQISSRETRPVHFKSLQGAEMEFLKLPYPLPAS